MKVNTTEYHLFPIVDQREPEFVRAAVGFVAITVTKTEEFPDQVAVAFLDVEHNPKTTINADDFGVLVGGAIKALDSLGHVVTVDVANGMIIQAEEPRAS